MDLNPATLYAYNAETRIAGTTMYNIALTGVPLACTSAALSGNRRSNAAAKITRVDERNNVPAQPNHQVLINNKTTICTRRLFVRNTASIAGLGHTGIGGKSVV